MPIRVVATSDQPLIQIEKLTRHYGRRRGIEALSLSVREGALFGFLGPNGAGKTTTIRVMLGFLRPSAGRAYIFGLDCWKQSKRIKAEVGYVPGDLRLPPWMSGATALSTFGRVRARELGGFGRELAERFDLDLRVKVREMSRGMRQKLGLLLAMAHKPRLLVLDEPTRAFDPRMQHSLARLLREWAAAGHTIFFSSHSMGEVEELCDHVAIVREGELVANQSLAALRARAGHDVSIRWREGANLAGLTPPEFLKPLQQDGLVWRGTLHGGADRLVDFLAGKPLEELSIGRPDLESLFRRFYEHGEQRR